MLFKVFLGKKADCLLSLLKCISYSKYMNSSDQFPLNLLKVQPPLVFAELSDFEFYPGLIQDI